IGYQSSTASVDVSGDVTLDFSLAVSAVEMSALEVLASRAGEKTPVAHSTVDKAEMEFRLGSQDLPMTLNLTPSVYATQQGGGAGDARINVRGFNQRNIAVMINGVPQNDMENGWVYWSNWDGVADAAHSIQMQRGLSAVNLATPSIGGTMNVITDPAAHEKGGKYKQEVGAGGFLKSTFNYNSGLIGDKLALSGAIVRKTGDGVIDKAWTDAWAYYFGASYALNKDNRFELYAIGAPQRHGQNLYKQNIGAYDAEFAESVDGYDTEALGEDGKFKDVGHKFNQNWAPIDASYTGKQYYYMYGAKTVDRHDPNFLNERENFFHKPLVNLNHFMTINDKTRLSSVLYWSGGSGGGTGTYGRIPTMDADGNLGDDDYKFYYGRSPWTRDWNALVAMNSGDSDTVYVDKRVITRTHGVDNNQSVGILRNSINRQNTYGLISKLHYDLSDELKLQVGIDWRTAGIEHAREVRDLMGGDYYMDYADDNASDGKRVELGDIIAYHNETTVDWLGGFLQGSYSSGPLSAYGMAGVSSIKYSYQDHFTVADEVIKAEAISTTQFKGGAMYDVSDNISVFGNFGIVEKPPIMDNVIHYSGAVAEKTVNEQFTSFEAGLNFNSEKAALKASYYNTQWKDRNLTRNVTTGQGSSGDTDIIFLTGVNQSHSGFEVEGSYQVMDMLRLDMAAGFGDWYFDGDAKGDYQEFTDAGVVSTSYEYGLDKLKVGDMPQSMMVVGATVTPISGLRIQGLFNWYDNNYSDWSPASREISGGTADRDQVWMAPGYSKIDLHAYYNLPMSLAGTKLQVFAHVFNLTDALYIQDAVDNSQYNAWDKDHDADSAEVFFGSPTYFNMGLTVRF
ncbi:MAG: TonB-dependent receptor plug domain-containing protein, partial [Candidatus Marinimicrobia bacterium]|nr:TonB-dependent receptor plug domain-containing protein [Candidatus Neomarinimicrobiota bacterium]